MKPYLIALLALAPTAAMAASAEGQYLADRDAYIAKFTAAQDSDSLGDYDQHNQALDKLGAELAPVIGAAAVKGFSAQGEINLETLFPDDVGFAMLDGLVYPSDDGNAEILVTTLGLAKTWLQARRDQTPPDTDVPLDLDEALASEPFYTYALSADAAVERFADIPVNRPKADFAYAMLDERTQDVALGPPNEMIISVVEDGRLFIVTAGVETPLHAIPACDKIWQDYDARAEKAATDYQNSDPQDEALFDKYLSLRDEGDTAFHKCFAEQAKDQDFYAPLVKEAQALVDRLP